MALLAEQIVEEWLTRQGYFTIRGLRLGNDEIDLLAIKHLGQGKWKHLHVEVQVSIRPVSYISGLTKDRQIEYNISGARNAKKRTEKQLQSAVDDWLLKKYFSDKKKNIRKQLSNSTDWEFLFVHGKVKTDSELNFIRKNNIEVKDIKEILKALQSDMFDFKTGAATDIIELIELT